MTNSHKLTLNFTLPFREVIKNFRLGMFFLKKMVANPFFTIFHVTHYVIASILYYDHVIK